MYALQPMHWDPSLFNWVKKIVLVENIISGAIYINKEFRRILWHRKRSLSRSKFNCFIQHINLFLGIYLSVFLLPKKTEGWISANAFFMNDASWEAPNFTLSMVTMAIFACVYNLISYKPVALFNANLTKSLLILTFYGIVSVLTCWEACSILFKKLIHRGNSLYLQWSR